MRRAVTACLALGAALVASCRTPTEITLILSTDVKCTDLRGTSVTVGHLGEIETKAATTSSTFCDASGLLGELVVVPSGSVGDEVAMKVVAGVGRDADTCVPPYGKGCIVARRAMHFVPHTPLRISVALRASCDGVTCADTDTCVAGHCTSAEIADPGACNSAGGCDETSLGTPSDAGPPNDAGTTADATGTDGAPSDAGADAFVDPATYHDMTNGAFWTAFNLTNVSPQAKQFAGARFDGRYVYLVPYAFGQSGVTARYDTQAPFAAAASWTTFDVSTLNANAKGFIGGAFDGRYFYLVPYGGGTISQGLATRYDTQAPFGTSASWSIFDTTTVNAQAAGFTCGAFDGRYVYFVPYLLGGVASGLVARYDTQSAFGAGASWLTFDVSTVNANAKSFSGAAFDGRYLYLSPYGGGSGGTVTRFDTQAPFAAAGSWSTFDTFGLGVAAGGFGGAVFDGRYAYFVPFGSNVVARYDTQATFGVASSWATFALPAPYARYQGATFDGRYVYFVPNRASTSVAFSGLVLRYDTRAPFATATSWSRFDTGALGTGFWGAAFDGQYVYLVPYSGTVVVRFDAKTPPALPPFTASFL